MRLPLIRIHGWLRSGDTQRRRWRRAVQIDTGDGSRPTDVRRKHQFMLAHDDTVAIVERGGVANLGVVDEGAVATPQIDHRVAGAIVAQERMAARGELIVFEDNLARGRASNGDILPGERIFTGRLAGAL